MRPTFLAYCKPVLSDEEINAAVSALTNSWLTTGPIVREFENAFAERAHVRHAVALSSCTAALHVALGAMGVGPGDEVVMPSFTFVAGAQCTIELGAKPVFADVDPETFAVTVATLDAVVSEKTKVIIAMPYGGRPIDIARIVEYAHNRGIRVLEDAAHAAGMLDRGEWAGVRSDAAAYSFYATKNITTCEGGMLLTNNDELASRARILGLHGMDADAWKRYTTSGTWRYDVVAPGFKYNLADPLAAIGINQLKRLDTMQQRRDEIARRYIDGLAAIPGFIVQALPSNPGDRHSWCMFAVMIDEDATQISRDELIEALRGANIGASVHYIPTHLFSGYRSYQTGPLTNTERIGRRIFSLPLYPAMNDEDVDDVLQALERIVVPRVFSFTQPLQRKEAVRESA